MASDILVVPGVSGVGKSAAVAALAARKLSGLVCHHFDSIGVPDAETIARDFGSGERWQAHATAQWMDRLLAEAVPGVVQILDGQTRPSFVHAALRREDLSRVRIVLVECERESRNARLVARGHPELANPGMDSWSAYLRGQADALGLTVLDTTPLAVAAVADALQELALSSPSKSR